MTSYFFRAGQSVFCVAIAAYSAHVRAASDANLAKFYNLSLSELGKIEITTATGSSTPLDRAPATATVITAAEIKAIGARNLDEILETVPGLHVSLSSLSRLDSIYSIRGVHTGFNPHVLLLMNGIPVQFSLQGGRPLLFRYPVTNISRIEVIRGPGSAIYGADAYSGVINIITKDADTTDQNEIGASVASFQGREFWSSGKTKLRSWDMTFGVTYQTSDGDDDRRVNSDLQTGLDAALGSEASLAPGALSTRYEILNTHIGLSQEKWSINFWSWNSNDSGVGAGAAQALDFRGGDENDLYLTDVTYQLGNWSEDWDHRVRASYLYYDTQAQLNLLPPGTVVPIGSDGNVDFVAPAGVVAFPDGLIGNPGGTAEDSQFDFISLFRGWENHRWRIAIGARHQSFDSRESKNFGPGVIDGTQPVVDGILTNVSDTPFVFIKDTSRTTRYISIQDEWSFAADWELTAGVRFDDYSDFGSTTNPRLALVWAAHEKVTTKFLYGSAFRAPSFSEQFNENNPVSLGSADLDPEVIDTYELALNIAPIPTLQTSVSFFSYQAEDMIEFVPDEGATTNSAQNARDQKGKGFEWEVNWDALSSLRLKASYSWSEAKDKSTDNDIPDAPQKQLSVNVNWEILPNYSLNTNVNWVADRSRSSLDAREPIDDYTIVDFNFRKSQIFSNTDLIFTVKNALDEEAREPSNGTIAEDYPLASRSVWLGVNFQF